MYSKKRTSSGPKNDSSDELDIGAARQVKSFRRGCARSSVSWIPIAVSPVSSSTSTSWLLHTVCMNFGYH